MKTLNMRSTGALLKNAAVGWSDKNSMQMSAAIAYYTAFSIAPLLVLAIACAGLIFGKDAAQRQIVSQIGGLFGSTSADFLKELIEKSKHTGSGVFASISGFLLLLVGASGVFGELQSALNKVWAVSEKKGGGLWGFLKSRLLSFSMVFAMGFLLMSSLVASAVLAGFSGAVGAFVPARWTVLVEIMNSMFTWLGLGVLVAVLLKNLPDCKVEWRDVWFGAAFTSLLFVVGKYLISLYIGTSSIESAYGAAGTFAALLIWFFYLAQIFLFGAELTRAHAEFFKEIESQPL